MKIFVLLLSVAMFAACTSKNFKQHESGVEYLYIEENSDAQKVEVDDVLVLDMRYYTENDSLLFDSREVSGNFRMKANEPIYKGGTINDALQLLHKGDSLHFKIDARLFYEQTRDMKMPEALKVGDKVVFHVRLKEIQTFAKVEEERQKLHYTSSREEMIDLQHYLEMTNTTVEPSENGLYYVETVKGEGKKAENGKRVVVHYTGKFINGQIFDSSLRRNEPFEFTLGAGEVIQGWDEGVLNMQEGSEARLVIPSNMAYGKAGAGDVIPPYSTIIFEIELLEVK